MDNCPICNHPKHDGRRCLAAITKEVSVPHKGLVFSRIDTVANCACGMLDEIIAATGIEPEEVERYA